jgi:DNA-damage-inducible protein D
MNEEQNSIQTTATTLFDSIKHTLEDGTEYWEARELSVVLGYARWENFENVVKKAKISLENSGGIVENHFRDITKMVEVGSSTVRPVKDILLSRHACYVLAQNGDSSKNEIALAQAYFSQQTQLNEQRERDEKDIDRLEARQKLTLSDKQLSGVILKRDVDRSGLSFIKSQGDKRLFGGKTTREMKDKYNIKGNKPLADHLPTISLTAKQLVNEMTTINTVDKNLRGRGDIGFEHLKNNDEVRKSLVARGIKLEELPPEEDIKKVQRRVASKGKKKLQ